MTRSLTALAVGVRDGHPSFVLWLASDPTIAVPVWPMIGQLLFLLLLPVAVGMTVRHRWPVWSARRRGAAQRRALLGLLALFCANP